MKLKFLILTLLFMSETFGMDNSLTNISGNLTSYSHATLANNLYYSFDKKEKDLDDDIKDKYFQLSYIAYKLASRARALGYPDLAKFLVHMDKEFIEDIDYFKTEPALKLISLEDVPENYISIVTKLTGRPIFDGHGAWVKQAKILGLEDWDDCLITEILTENAKELTKENNFSIRNFGGGYNSISFRGKYLGRGLQFLMYENYSSFSLEALKNSYKSTINKLKSGWERTTLSENKDIFHTESEEEWFLFIKKNNSLINESILIRSLADKFGMKDNIECYNYWKSYKGPMHKDEIYLWVKKDSLEEFIRIFGFDLKV